MSSLFARRAFTALVAPTLFAACDSQTTPDYEGERMAAVRGNVSLGSLSAPPAMDVILLWTYDPGDGDQLVGQRADLEGGVPASFELSLREPPPPVLFERRRERPLPAYAQDEGLVLLAAIMALPAGASPGDGPEGGMPGPLAISKEYVVAWVDSELKADTYAANLVGGPLSKGYHLLEVVPAEQWTADHPEEAACFDAFGDWTDPACSEPDIDLPEDEYDAAWATYEECTYTHAKAKGCLLPAPERDRLRPAPAGFETLVTLELVASEDELDGPNLQ